MTYLLLKKNNRETRNHLFHDSLYPRIPLQDMRQSSSWRSSRMKAMQSVNRILGLKRIWPLGAELHCPSRHGTAVSAGGGSRQRSMQCWSITVGACGYHVDCAITGLMAVLTGWLSRHQHLHGQSGRTRMRSKRRIARSNS